MGRKLFDPVVQLDCTHPYFRAAHEESIFAPARKLMEEIFSDFRDVDKNFVREFQTGGFSPRLFELALYAYLQEQGYDLDRTSPAPDFVHRGEKPFAIEVTTTNPPQDGSKPDPRDVDLVPDDLDVSTRAFIFQIGKALRRKLQHRDSKQRHYWEKPEIQGLPFVIAVAAFHDVHAQLHPVGYVANYLYGQREMASYDDYGNLIVTSEQINTHESQGKSIPSGLFKEPEASNLAGVIFTNSHTISKFSRIGFERGYGAADTAILRFGSAYDPDPNAAQALPFAYVVEKCDYNEQETFAEGLDLFLNPWAENPLDPEALRGINVMHLLEDGRLEATLAGTWQPFNSKTVHFHGKNAFVRAVINGARIMGDLP